MHPQQMKVILLASWNPPWCNNPSIQKWWMSSWCRVLGTHLDAVDPHLGVDLTSSLSLRRSEVFAQLQLTKASRTHLWCCYHRAYCNLDLSVNLFGSFGAWGWFFEGVWRIFWCARKESYLGLSAMMSYVVERAQVPISELCSLTEERDV